MESLDQLNRLLAYDEWANREFLKALAALEAPPEAAVRLMGHIIGAERLWLARLTDDSARVAVWPTIEPKDFARALEELFGAWRRYEATLTEDRLLERVSYTNSKGEPWTSTTGDILMHVVIHAGYHRGQIAIELRRAGHTPPYTDFIHAVRQGFIG
jgi:uncharacterized damage-inducible protein DinB